MMWVLVFLALAGAAEAQTIVGDRLQLATGCTIRSGSGAPGTGLGAVCDTYLRTDSPYTVYVKTGASTWTATAIMPASAAAGDLITATGADTIGRVAAVASGSVLASAGTSTAPAYTAAPSVTTLTTTGVGGSNGINMSSTNPVFRMYESDAAADNGVWNTRADAEAMLYRAVNDAGSSSGTYLRVERTGATIDSMTLGGALTQPDTGYFQNLGSLSRKFLTLHAAELWVETLVAQNTIATIGGRVLIGPTTTLTSDLTSGATSIIVKHNQMVSGDRVYMEANGKVEFLAVTSGASGSGPYTYSVTRDLDGTGANAWTAGDAVFNTGQTGSGFIDLYSVNSATFAGLQAIFNFNASGSVYSSNYVDTDIVPFLGDSANDTINDAIYFGAPATFGNLSAYVLTPLALGTGTAVWEFWNGSAWTSFTPTGAGFAAVGPGLATTGTLTGWATTTVNSVSAYWIRYRVTAVGSGITAGSWRLVRRGQQQWGPTIVGNVRTSSTFNDWYPRWAIGNLQGLYGYSAPTYGAAFGDEAGSWVKIDDTNGVRLGNASTTNVAISPSGDASFISGNLSIDSTNGIQLTPTTTVSSVRSYRFVAPTGLNGMAANEDAGVIRQLYLTSLWTGTGNLSSGTIVELASSHLPSSGGSFNSADVKLTANGSGSTIDITSSTLNLAAEGAITVGGVASTMAVNAETTFHAAVLLDGLASCTLAVDGAGEVGCVSDSNAKTDIRPWTGGGDVIARLKPSIYRWKDGDKSEQIGFIAQDVAPVIPQAVRWQGWGGGGLTLDDRAILAALVSAVQELQKARQ